MTHESARLYLGGYDRKDLGPSIRARLDQHLDGCRDCAAYGESLFAFAPVLEQLSECTPPGFDSALDSVRRRTLRSVREEAAQGRRLGGWFGRLAHWQIAVPVALAATLLVALAINPAGRDFRAPAGSSGVSSTATAQLAMPQGPVVMPAANFEVHRKGTDVQIEWPQNGRPHRVRKAADPAEITLAHGQLVQGRVWNDPGTQAAPGSVTFYLID